MAIEEYSPRELTVIQQQPDRAPSVVEAWTDEDLTALAATVAKDCDKPQFKVFVAACARLNLDPFARQIVPIVMGGRMTPQVTIDGFRLIAERTRKYRGQIGPYWCGKDGEWREVWLDDAAPTACKVGVLRADFEQPVWGVARTKAYAKGGLWNTMPDVMIAKVAESLALRKAFPNELSGAYIREEMDQARAEELPDEAPARVVDQAVSPARKPAEITADMLRAKYERKEITGEQWAALKRVKKGNIPALYAALDSYDDKPAGDPDSLTLTPIDAEGHELDTLPAMAVRP